MPSFRDRYHFIAVIGGIFALIPSPPQDWKSAPAMRAAVFLALSYSPSCYACRAALASNMKL